MLTACPTRRSSVLDDVVAILVVAVEALLLARLLARLGRLARERRWRCDRFQRRRGRKQGRRRAAAEQEQSRHPQQQHRAAPGRSEEHTSELQSLIRISSAVLCLKIKKHTTT